MAFQQADKAGKLPYTGTIQTLKKVPLFVVAYSVGRLLILGFVRLRRRKAQLRCGEVSPSFVIST